MQLATMLIMAVIASNDTGSRDSTSRKIIQQEANDSSTAANSHFNRTEFAATANSTGGIAIGGLMDATASAMLHKYTRLWIDCKMDGMLRSGELIEITYLAQQGYIFSLGYGAMRLNDDATGSIEFAAMRLGAGARIWQRNGFHADLTYNYFPSFSSSAAQYFAGGRNAIIGSGKGSEQDGEYSQSSILGNLAAEFGWTYRGFIDIAAFAKLWHGKFEYKEEVNTGYPLSGNVTKLTTTSSIGVDQFQLGINIRFGLPLIGESGKKYIGAGSIITWKDPQNTAARSE